MFSKVFIPVAFLIAVIASDASAQATPSPETKGSSDKNIEKILGTWKVQKITSGKTDVAKNPTSGHWIEFRPDGHYVNKTTSIDSGSFRMNENSSVLYLESMVNSGAAKDDAKKIVEWSIAFGDNTLTMQQQNKEKKAHVDNMQYVYTRIASGSRKLNN